LLLYRLYRCSRLLLQSILMWQAFIV
jgi:hypothetical protein